MTLEKVLKEIDSLFSDTSRSLEATINDMEEIESVVTMNIEALKADIKMRDAG